MQDMSATVLWFRRDLRLTDHAALSAAVDRGGPVIPVFVCDSLVESLGAAPRWRLSLGIARLGQALQEAGSQLILRRGPALEALSAVVRDSGAGAVYWTRAYDPDSVARDRAVKAALTEGGVSARSFPGHLMFEPWAVETKTGGYYRVYTPFWKGVRDRDVPQPLAAPGRLPAPEAWPASDNLEHWHLGRGMRRGAAVVRPHVRLGEAAARDRLGAFMDRIVAGYDTTRDLPGTDGTSGLSENLALGEISPAQCWHAGQQALAEGKPGAETFLKELVWREFAYHLMWHTPHLLTGNWRPEWDAFPWSEDRDSADVQAWTRARTGLRFVDAGLREMVVTGRMHNRARMIVASVLTKHLLSHWRIGMDWFAEHLIDWDPASNAMGWQWSAGSGPDATPYFRVFNPVTQLDKFDKQRTYVNRWIAEDRRSPDVAALSYFEAIPRSWGMSPGDSYPAPVVDAAEGRRRALDAYAARGF